MTTPSPKTKICVNQQNDTSGAEIYYLWKPSSKTHKSLDFLRHNLYIVALRKERTKLINLLLLPNKILPNFKISSFYHLKIQAKLFTIFRLTRSKNIWMDFIECEKLYSSFKDDQFYLQKKGFCKIDIDNDQDICYFKLNPHISMRILSTNFPILNLINRTVLLVLVKEIY
ncbi:hypothetical protein BpHYR1_000596 [Brachionus plicatilis]|uniref:Uncharacterized protein n=1 Tax=Brachionus plicatilis TaxID=10195 RepID=A0A3M7R5R3_BRAPC|nr:hypothetical protein BpHYR1_000596 [Brachionus plicatilis]